MFERLSTLVKRVGFTPTMVVMPIQEFGSFQLDAATGVLFHQNKRVGVGRRGVALLKILLDHAGHQVSKQALLSGVWPGEAIEDSNVNVQIASLRRVLNEVEGAGAWIVTLPGKGYSYLGPQVSTIESPKNSEKLSRTVGP